MTVLPDTHHGVAPSAGKVAGEAAGRAASNAALVAALGCLESRIADGALVADLVDLIAIPSVTGTRAETEATRWLASRLRAMGAEVDHWEIDVRSLSEHQGFPGCEAPRDEAWGLVGTWGDGVPALVLAGHLDVVPAGDVASWGGDPFTARIEAGRVIGRGAADMKAGVVALLAACTAVRHAGLPLARALAVHGLVGEEDGGLGAFATLQRGHHGEACVIPEPTAGSVVVATAGALSFRLEVPGRSAHGSTRYQGVDPIERFAHVHAALRELEVRRNSQVDPLMSQYPIAYPLAIGTVHAGEWASTVPDRLIAEGRFGVALDEDPADARAELERAVMRADRGDSWPAANPVRVTWWGGQFGPGRLVPGSALLPAVQRCWAEASGASGGSMSLPPAIGASYGSDLRLYAAAGIPTLHLGPGDVAQAHTVDEWVSVDDLHLAARALTRLIVRTCCR